MRWMTNVHAEDKLPDCLRRLVRSKPKATHAYSSSELAAMGMIGLYDPTRDQDPNDMTLREILAEIDRHTQGR